MKSTVESTPVRHLKWMVKPLTLPLLFVAVCATTTFAQSVIAPLQPNPRTEAAAKSLSPGAAVEPSAPITISDELRWGPMNFHPHFSYRYLYGDGIQAAPGTPTKKTAINSFSAGLFTELGKHWTADYTPTWTFYSSRAFHDTVDQTGQITWTTKYEEWTLTAAHNYTNTDSPMIETGRQTQQTSHTSSFNAWYALNSRYALETALKQALRFAETSNDTREWSIREMLHRQA